MLKKMKHLLFLSMFFFFVQTTAFSQQPTGSDQKTQVQVNNAILKFKQTDFMLKFGDFKFHMESSAKNFISQQSKYKQDDVRKVQYAYEKTAARFNLVILSIKEDFLDKKKVDMINKFPDMYSDGLVGKMNELDKFYKANFQQTLNDVTNTEGSTLILALIELIKSATDLSGYFKNMKYDKLSMSDDYIKKNLVDPVTFTTWADLVANTPKNDNSNNGNNGNNNNGNNGNNNNGNNGNNNNGNNGNNNNGNNDNTNNGNALDPNNIRVEGDSITKKPLLLKKNDGTIPSPRIKNQ